MFDIRRHFAIVPNVSFGLLIHECDLLVVRNSGYALEVEIKVSVSDLKRDVLKRHGHRSHKIKELYFAVPAKLYDVAVEHAPSRAGIIVVSRRNSGFAVNALYATIDRPAVPNKDARPLTAREMQTVARLGAMRIWALKRKLIEKA